jgi:uncharacterized membrane protein YkvI
MTNFPCPHCGVASFTAWQKSFIGPVFPNACRSCGNLVASPTWPALVFAPQLYVSFAIGSKLELFGHSLVGGVIGGLALTLPTLAIWVFLVPLERR